MRFSGARFRTSYTSEPNSIILETVFQVNGVFNASFRWFFMPWFSCELHVENIDRFVGEQSMMQCYGGHYYNRWCEVWNVCWKWKRFHFYSDTATFFKLRIAYPGSRPVPHDYLSCRIIFRMLAERTTMHDYSHEIATVYNETSILTCRWNGMQHFWHVLFDFTIPLWWSMRIHNTTNRETRLFTLDDNSSKKGYQFCDALSQHDVENIRNMTRERLSCWRHAIIGVPKAERVVQPEKWSNGTYDLPYEYPHEAVIGMRERFLEYYNPNETRQSIENRCQPDPKRPRVLVTFRLSNKRHIVNKMELVDAMREWCPECIIDYNYARNETIQTQLNTVCNASLLIAIHGGGLSHMLFQKASTPEAPTAAIEILPYKYTCRNWYRWAAMTAGVRYFHWINPYINKTVPYRGPKTSPCFDNAECMSDQCHDLLRDQLTTVDLDDFKRVFMKAIRYVKRESPFDEVDLANQTNETATVL